MWTPLRSPLTSSILHELQWFHAVNSEAHLRHALHTTAPSSSSCSSSSHRYVGLEIDVHACPHDPHAVLLRHDATPRSSREEEYTFEDFVDQLSSSLSANAAAVSPPSSSPSSLPVATTIIVLAVLKIDCKTPEAWRRLIPTLESTRRRLQLPKLCLWMNADVVAGPPPSPSLVEPPSPSVYPFLLRTNNSEESSSSSPHEWLVQELLAPCLDLQVGLSLGWTTHPSSTTPYSNEHVEAMMELLRCLWSRCPQTDDMLLTFPVRYSLVFVKRDNNNEPKEEEDCRGDGVAAMQRMLSLAAACVCKHLPCGDLGNVLPPAGPATERLPPPHSNNNASSSHWCGESVLPFLTFWRGRDETISDGDTQRCLSLFHCTVDRS